MTDAVRAQYEGFPYPPRDPADETKRLITGSPSHLDELNHYVFGGRRDFAQPFRALVAGGGTGDATIMLAQQLADAGCPAEIVHIEPSDASRRIAAARAEVRGLAAIRFEASPIEALPSSGLGRFDYIDCCGVLHHLADPAAGLQALKGSLADGGGLGLMVYGEFGRSGVYPMQEMLRQLAADDEPASARLAVARRLLAALPASNLLRRNPFVQDHLKQGDPGLYDLLLHARDRAYTVQQVAGLVAGAGLRLVAFIEPALYDPASYLADADLLARLAPQPWLERCAFAERLSSHLRKHIVYAVDETNAARVPDPRDPAAVPVLRGLDAAAFAATVRPGSALTATIDGVKLRRLLPPLAGAMIRRIDGRTSGGAIVDAVLAETRTAGRDEVVRQFAGLFAALNGVGKAYQRCPAG